MTKEKGELYPKLARRHYSLLRVPLEGALSRFVEHVWIIRWNLPGDKSYVSEVLPYPAANIVFVDGGGWVAGVGTKKFSYELKGSGVIVGVLCKPAGFHAFCPRPQADLRDKTVSLHEAFSGWPSGFAAEILTKDDGEIIQGIEHLLMSLKPVLDSTALGVHEIVEKIAHDRSLKKVAEVATAEGMSERRLEQLFYEYVGVTPKWVIERYRLHEAADRLNHRPDLRLAELAHELGYSDQAHFARAFKRIIGRTPTEYGKRQAG